MKLPGPWLWRILRPHYWQLDRRVRGTNRWLIILPIAVIVLAGNWISRNLLPDFLALLDEAGVVGLVAYSLPFMLFIFFLFGLLGIEDIIRQLFQASDLPILLAAPIPLRAVFVARLLQASRFAVIPGLLLGGLLLLVGLATEAPPVFYTLAAVCLLAAVILVTAVVMTLVLFLVRWLPPQRVRSWLPVAILLLLLFLSLGQQSFSSWVSQQEPFIAYLTEALLVPEQLVTLVVVLAGLALVTAIGAMAIFERAFLEGWNRFAVVPEMRPAAVKSSTPGLYRLVRPLPGPQRYIILKEWLTIRRTPSSLISLGLPLVFMVIILAPVVGSRGLIPQEGTNAGSLQPLLLWYFLFFFGILLITLPAGIPLLALLQEGADFTLLRQAPVAMTTVLQGKLWATVTPLALAGFVVLPTAGIWLAMPAWEIMVLLMTFVWSLIGTSISTLAIGGWTVDFTADDLRRRMPRVANYLTLTLNALFVALSLAATIWLVVHLWPASAAVTAIRPLASFRLVGWFFADTIWLPLSLFMGQVGFWLVTARIWSAAVHRLEHWEPG